MKALLCFCILISSAFAQDPAAYVQAFDSKVYSLKNKGVQDFVVDIESSKLTKQLNEQQLFGKLKEVVFRIYWTAKPERLAIEVLGMPEGFKEVKEDLKASILTIMDNLIPQTTAQRFIGYKMSAGPGPKQITVTDTSGLAAIPSFLLKFDPQDKLIEVVGNKPIGTFVVTPEYEKSSFAGGGWILAEQTTTTVENGQTLTVKKELDYEKSNGVGVLSEVTIITTQALSEPKVKPTTTEETLEFKNYKINEGVALNYFLGEAKASETPTKP
jgi:hypothetical protein